MRERLAKVRQCWRARQRAKRPTLAVQFADEAIGLAYERIQLCVECNDGRSVASGGRANAEVERLLLVKEDKEIIFGRMLAALTLPDLGLLAGEQADSLGLLGPSGRTDSAIKVLLSSGPNLSRLHHKLFSNLLFWHIVLHVKSALFLLVLLSPLRLVELLDCSDGPESLLCPRGLAMG